MHQKITTWGFIGVGLLLVLTLFQTTPVAVEQSLPHEYSPFPTPPTFVRDTSISATATPEQTSPTSTHIAHSLMLHTPTTAKTEQTSHQEVNVSQARTLEYMAWIYPYPPACGASAAYSDGRTIDILKPEFFTINGGSLRLLDAASVPCNGYSPTFVEELTRYSTQQFVTVSSASGDDMATFLTNALTVDTSTQTLVDFVVSNNLSGIELNFEDFGSWSPQNYIDFKTFITRLGSALHASGKQLMVVGPPIANNVEASWFVWRYEDFTNLPVDRMVVMGYDYQYDHGAGEPIAPLPWLRDVISWVSARYPQHKLTLGLPAYGYMGKSGTMQISILTHEQIRNRVGYTTATRDPLSAEMTWSDGNTVHYYQDSYSLTAKRQLAESLGIRSFSVWHLGGNPWFTNE